MKVFLRRFFKVVCWLIAGIVLLLVLVVILIQLPAVQNFAKNRAVAYLQHKIGTPVRVGRLTLNFPKRIILEDVYVEDQHRDTLFSGDTIRVDIALLKLLKKEVEIDHIELSNIHTHIYRLHPDTVYNYDYIVRAFAGEPDPTPPKTATGSSSLVYRMGTIHLKQIHARFQDDATGNAAQFYLDDLCTRFKAFDPSRLLVSIPSLQLKGIDASIRQYRPTVRMAPVPVTAAVPGNTTSSLRLDSFVLQRVRFRYDDELSALHAGLSLRTLEVLADTINLQQTRLGLKKITLDSTVVSVVYDQPPPGVTSVTPPLQATSAAPQQPWRVDLAQLSLTRNSFSYNDNNMAPLKRGMDYHHMALTGFEANLSSLAFTQDSYKGDIRQIGFREKSGFLLRQLSAAFLYNNKEAALKNLLIETGGSVIKNQLTLRYSSAASIRQTPGEIDVDMAIPESHIAVSDLLLIAPMLHTQLAPYRRSVLDIKGNAKGRIKDLTIAGFEVKGLGNTALLVSGNLKGLPDAQKGYYDIHLQRFTTSSRDLANWLPPASLPSNVRLPQQLLVKGRFKGSVQNFTAHVDANTSSGSLVADGRMQNQGAAYNARLVLDKVNLGYLLKQEKNVGTVSLVADAHGKGLEYKKMTAALHAKLTEGHVKGYVYHNFILDGAINKGVVRAKAALPDKNLHFTVDLAADVKPVYPSLYLNMALDTADLRALHLVKDTFTLRGKVNAVFASTNPDSLQGTLLVNNLAIVKDSLRVITDSIEFNASRQNRSQVLSLHAEMLQAELAGEYKLTQLGKAFRQLVSKYYPLPGNPKDTAVGLQQGHLSLLLKTSPLVLQFLPQLKGTDTLSASMDFATATGRLDATLLAPDIRWGEQAVANTRLYINALPGQLNYGITLDKAGSTGFYVNQTSLKGHVADSTVFATLLLKDQKVQPRYQLSTRLKPVENGFWLSLDKDSVLLNYKHWTIPADNYLRYDSAGILVHNLQLSQNKQTLRINSEADTANAPVSIVFKDFSIQTLTNFAEQDSLLLDGVINGQALVSKIVSSPVFTSNLTVGNLTYKTDTIGTLSVKVNNQEANTFIAQVDVQGRNTDVQLKGRYFTGESKMDLKLDIHNLDLSMVKGFAAGQLKQIGGSLKGSIAFTGTLQQPAVNGNIHLEKAFIQPTLLGERFNLANEEISVNEQGIRFNKFTMTDSSGNKAILDGNIFTTDFIHYRFGLNLNARDFRLVNATKADNPMFYGKLNMDANVRLTGDLQAPVVKATFRANKSTDFTLVLPGSDPEVVSREGVVNFIDHNKQLEDTTLTVNVDSLLHTQALKGIDFDANIETDSAAQFTVVVDELNGDALKIKGRANLAAGIDPSGKLSLTGNYELNSGSYQVTLSVLKKKFTVRKGSTITWTGDPMTANLNLTGVYEIEASSIDLVQDNLAGQSGGELTRFKQKLPFQVLLKMSGDLLKPAISFDIVLPKEEQNQWKEVETRLEQLRTNESEMNKQVFALLLLGRFVQEDPLQSDAAGTSVETRIRQSVSNILSDQLNKLAGSLVKGVDLNFGLNTDDDYTTGNRETKTDLTVGVSKSLLNDRLKVSVGSNFELQGPAAGSNQASNIAGDVAVDYQLTKDGRYMIRGYRRNKYDAVVEGQVVETGLTFVFTLDYDRFWELFQSKKKYWSKKRRQRQQKSNIPANAKPVTNTDQ